MTACRRSSDVLPLPWERAGERVNAKAPRGRGNLGASKTAGEWPMRWTSALLAVGLAVAYPVAAQDSKAWLEAQNLDAVDTKGFQEFEAVVARNKGAKDAKNGEDRVVIFKQGKPHWQSNPKETDPGSRWPIHSIGRDLDGDGQPDVHFRSHT